MSQKIKIVLILLIVTASIIFFVADDQSDNFSTSLQSSKTNTTDKNTTITSSNNISTTSTVDISGKLPSIPSFATLQGTRIHGNLRVDDQGNLIIDNDIKKLLHYFLNVEGELSREELVKLLRKGISDYLPQPAEGQALEILTQYLAYQNALQEQINQGIYQLQSGGIEGYRQAFELRNQLRIQYLGAEVASAFFAEEEAYDLYTVTRLELSNNTSLSDAERTAQLNVLEEQLPEQYLNVRKKQQHRVAINEEINTLRENNASIYELQDTWTQHYGEEAAQRLVTLEVKRQEWKGRYDDYSQQRQSLQAMGLDDDSFESQLNALKESLFTEVEQKRIQALDKINEGD